MRNLIRGFSCWSVLLFGMAGGFARAEGDSPATFAPAIETAPAPANVAFLTPKTRLWLGRNQVLCFRAAQPAMVSQSFPLTSDDAFVQVLTPPTLMAGQKVGYIRLAPLKEGETRLQLGDSSISVEIVRDPAASRLAQTPEIVSPARGAVVWGQFDVGVEQLNCSSTSSATAPVLLLPDGRQVQATVVPNQRPGPHSRYAFQIDAQALPVGANQLVAVAPDGFGGRLVSDPFDVVVIHPSPGTIVSGECKDLVNTQPPAPKKPVPGPPREFRPPTVMTDDKGAFGTIVFSRGSNPPWCMPVTAPAAGLYELVLMARGDIGGDALPTLELDIDDLKKATTSARLATTEWHRVPVGRPFTLEPGPHTLVVRFKNNFEKGKDDRRCLYLASYELARLDPLPAPALASGNDPTMMMESGAPPVMNAGPKMAPASLLPTTLHVAFRDDLDGATIAGPVQINAQAWWPDQKHSPPPKIDLLVNGRVVSSATKGTPEFKVAVSDFQPGKNEVQLIASLPNAQAARSITESINLPADLAATDASLHARIVYPASGARVGWADAVVADVSGCSEGIRVDLLVDGQPQHLDLAPQNGMGPVLLPLLTRGVAPGLHTVQVVAQDKNGESAQSDELTVQVTGHEREADGKYARALLLLNRFGYGPDLRELAQVLTLGPEKWLTERLDETSESPAESNEKVYLQSEFPDTKSVVSEAWQYLITDANPVRARFVMWTENHFSTWLDKDKPEEKAPEHHRFMELGVAPFPDLLFASATSPAMLIYLDQRTSYAKKLNENYAREIMELHTLGVKGGYNQKDVTTLADLLTGWTMSDEAPLDGEGRKLEGSFSYDPELNSDKACEILGMNFPSVAPEQRFDRVLTALSMLSAHPSCAQFISRKLAEHYVSDPAPPALVDAMARTFEETGGDMRSVLLTMAASPDFWSAPSRVASPIDFGVRLARMAGSTKSSSVNDLASRSGMGMFDRQTPDGYPDTDGYYTSSNALLQRWHFAQAVSGDFLNHGLIPSAWKPADNAWDAATIQKLVDIAAVRITGDILGAASNGAALKLVASAPPNTGARLHVLATFLCQVPETSLR